MTTVPEMSDPQANSNNKNPLVERSHPNVEENKDTNKPKAKKSANQRRRRHQQQSRNKPNQAHPTGATKSDNKLTTTATNATTTTTDPRNDQRRLTAAAQKRGKGRNTESFDPASTLVRPAMRIMTGSPAEKVYTKPLKHDDVIIVPGMFGAEDDFSIYQDLCREMTQLQETGTKGAEWIAWHEGAHLISKQPGQSKTFQKIINRLCEYFQIDPKSAGTRLNWYKDSRDWKPFHHDSAAFNPQRAKTQNITVGVSFGSSRELAFLLASDDDKKDESSDDVRLYFPQPNNGVFSFGRDVNIRWKHGINALPEEDAAQKQGAADPAAAAAAAAAEAPPAGRISIILWGLAAKCVEEEGSPSLLGSDGQGPHAAHNNKNFKHYHKHHRPRKHNKSHKHNKTEQQQQQQQSSEDKEQV